MKFKALDLQVCIFLMQIKLGVKDAPSSNLKLGENI